MRITHFITKSKNAQGALRLTHRFGTINRMGIGEKIRCIRKAKGLTIAQVQDAAGLADGNLSRVERGDQWVTEEKLYSIAAALGIKPGDLFSDADAIKGVVGGGEVALCDQPGIAPASRHPASAAEAIDKMANTADELQLLAVYRLANDKERAALNVTIENVRKLIAQRTTSQTEPG